MAELPSELQPVPVRFRSRLWFKLLVAYLLPVGLIVAGIGWFAYRAARVAMERQLGESLVAVARTAAVWVGKARAMRLAPGEEASLTYRNLREKLSSLQKAAEIDAIVLFDRRGRSLIDSRGEYAIGEPIMKLSSDRAELIEVFEGRGRASVLFEGKDGRWYKTGYAPVVLDGEVAAAVGADGSARFFGPLTELGGNLAMTGVAAGLLGLIVTLLVSRRITRPLGRLVQSARTIGRGELGQEIRPETSDEIGLLAATLNEMRQSIQGRDQRLQMMLSGIAHEVRNPLGGMSLFAGLLREELAGQTTALGHLERIRKELDYLEKVVNDFLDFARKKPLEVETVSPREEIEQVRALLAHDLEASSLRFSIEIDPGMEEVQWDRKRMRQVLLNLIRNAIQASPAGGSIQAEVRPEGSATLIAISDTGSGIPADRLERIFEPFFSTRQQGTGLGLALVRQVVEAHGGRVSVVSGPERGTTFILRIPAGARAEQREG